MVIRKEALTPAELQYVLTLGLECPNCRSMEKMEIHGHVQTDGGIAWQNIECGDCGALWVDTYTMTGFTDLDLFNCEEKENA